jgi:hypothetical protein
VRFHSGGTDADALQIFADELGIETDEMAIKVAIKKELFKAPFVFQFLLSG